MRILGLFLAAFAAILLFTGCETSPGYRVSVQSPPPPPPPPPPARVVVRNDHRGPPLHAPAHGYRHMHQDGYELVFDQGLGCYSVVGARDYYFNDGFFFRFGGDGWQASAHIGGNDVHWVRAEDQRVPERLRGKYKNKHKYKDKGRGHGRGDDDDHGGRGRGHDKHSMADDVIPVIKEARFGKY